MLHSKKLAFGSPLGAPAGGGLPPSGGGPGRAGEGTVSAPEQELLAG